jgi:sulfopropanediol 3-dehydrogenase
MEYLKKAPPSSAFDRLLVQQTVSEMLLEIERDGTDAIRRYSAKFDGWNPASFRVSAAQINEAEERVDSKLKAQIEFSRLQVERFARLLSGSKIVRRLIRSI